MEAVFAISGMTCGSCMATVKAALEKHPLVESAVVQLEAPQARLSLKGKVTVDELQKNLNGYTITSNISSQIDSLPSDAYSYRPLVLIIAFILGVSILVQYPFHTFNVSLWMRHFMAGFFIVFSFFKILNLKGFANTFKNYDILAARWYAWGLLYPFIELILGICYLINISPIITNIFTIVILGFSSIGVIQSNLQKRKIKCACLGDFFNLPMSTVTVIEDLGMVAMAFLMLL